MTSKPKRLTLAEVGERINNHLQRMEGDPKINVETTRDPSTPKGQGLRRFFNAHARYVGGRYLSVTYISYQGASQLTRDEAVVYLAALDAGSTERHHEALRRAEWRKLVGAK